MQPDANLVAYTDSDESTWSSDTYKFLEPSLPLETTAIPWKMPKLHIWKIGGILLASKNKEHVLKYEWSGDIVVYSGKNKKSITSTDSYGWKSYKDQHLKMQDDGNLVYYPTGEDSGAIWASNTWEDPKIGEAVQINDDGSVEVVNKAGGMAWKSTSKRLNKNM